MSAGGKDVLAELIAELARLQAGMSKLRSARREMNAATFEQELKEGRRQAARVSERLSYLGTILKAESAERGGGQSAELSRTVEAQSASAVTSVTDAMLPRALSQEMSFVVRCYKHV
jgi:hypothetical protein